MDPEAGKDTVHEIQTATATKLKAVTDAAVKAVVTGGFSDPEFEAEMQAAIDKDNNKAAAEPAKPSAPAKPAAVDKPADKPADPATPPKKVDITSDIPGELLGEKKTVQPEPKATDDAAAESERQKSIEEQTKGMTPKAAERFKKIEARAYEAEQKAKKFEVELSAKEEALKKKLAEVEVKPADTSEVDRLRKQVDELDALIIKNAMQEHPGFKAKYDSVIEKEIAAISKLVPAEHAEEVAQLAQLPDSKKRTERFNEIAETMEGLTKTKFLSGIVAVDKVAAARAEELTNWKDRKVHLEADEIRKREVDQAALQNIQKVAWTKGMENVMSPEGGLEVFRKTEGNDDWNAKVDARAEAVQKLLVDINKMPPEKFVELAARSVAVEDYRNLFLAQRMLNQKLTAQIEELSKAGPSTADTSGEDFGVEDKDDFISAVTKRSQKMGILK